MIFFKHHKDGNKLLLEIFGINVAVFLGWLASEKYNYLNDFMNKYFTWKNIERNDLNGVK